MEGQNMIYVKLNQAQKEMLSSERIFGRQALPVISVKLRLPDFTAGQVLEATKKVMESADLFTASLETEGDEVSFRPMSREISACVLREAMTEEEAGAYMEGRDRMPLDFPGELYGAEALPLKEGGTVLYVRFHHILIDGYGMSLFAQDVLDVLSGKALPRSDFFACAGEPSAGLEEAAAVAAAGNTEEDRRFWLDYFQGAEYAPALFAGTGGSLEKISRLYETEETFLRKCKDFAAANGVTVPYVLGAAYAVYLAQATGKRDAVFLMSRLNRKREELRTLGCYTLPVPVRVRVEQGDTFGEICRRLQENARLASAHKGYGLAFVTKLLREEGLAFGSLSEYAFNFYAYEIETSLTYSLAYSVSGGCGTHFRWNIFKGDGKLSFTLDAQKGIYEDGTADYFMDAIMDILERGLANERIQDIPCIGRREEEHLFSMRGKEIAIDKDATISSLFRKAATRYGHRPALYAGEKGYTFRELDECSDAIARELVEKGVESGDIVAFMLGRDIRLIPVLLGISKSGAAFLPIDPQYPKDRIEYILADSGAKFLVSSKDVEAAAGRDYLEADELIRIVPDEFRLPHISQEQRAYVIYTSGTTGRPKGVMLSHKGIANIVHPDNNPFNHDLVKNCRGIVVIGSICFDISLYEIFVPLFNGLFVELGNEKAMLDAGTLAELIGRHGADILHCTPSRVVSYLENPRFTEALKNHIKSMLLAGEQLPESLVRELRDRYGIHVYNGYGPTETTIGATITEAGDCQTIGMPIANTGILLLNGDKKLIPYGAPGEICVYGSGVGIGYRNRPKETEERFLLWGAGKRLRLYRTGDLGHFDPEGRLIYHGRNDRQVKLRGLRIELSEIEKVMGAYQGVSQAACILRKVEKRDHLAGFYTASPGSRVNVEQLRAFLKKQLTAYMVPELLTELKEMPQTPGGKTDFKALSEIPLEYTHSYTAPTNHMEEIICAAFAKVLNVEQVGIEDNFFELGGDSLRVVEFIAALEKKPEDTPWELSYESLFQYPTPALLAEKLSGEGQEPRPYPIDTLDYGGIDEYLRGRARDVSREGRDMRKNLGNVLLTGATGYLGIHILIELLQNPDICKKVYCLVRPKGRLAAERRLKNTLFYYAETDFSQSMGEKWEVLEGDITQSGIFREPFSGQIDTIINSAANVSHYAYGDVLEQVNRRGVENLIEYALSRKALLCQISTISVGGVEDSADPAGGSRVFSEENLYIGQKIYNQYIYSKYLAEYALLRAAAYEGLAVKIMRVGNLQGRSRDGEFQMNLKSNAFTRKLFAYLKMGAVPETVYRASVNFSPVDETAHMILTLAGTDARCSVFHVYPSREVTFSSLFEALKKQGYKIDVLGQDAFATRFKTLIQTREGRSLVEGLLTENPGDACREIPVTQRITGRLLESLGENWLPVTEDYLEKYLSALVGLSM